MYIHHLNDFKTKNNKMNVGTRAVSITALNTRPRAPSYTLKASRTLAKKKKSFRASSSFRAQTTHMISHASARNGLLNKKCSEGKA